MFCISWDHFRIEFQRICDLDGIGTVSPQEQLCIIEIIKIVHCITGAELNPLDLLEIDIKHLLIHWGRSAEFQSGKGLLKSLVKFSVEHGRQRRILYGIVSRFCRIVDHLSPIRQDHELIVVNMDHRSVRYSIRCTLAASAFFCINALDKDAAFAHFSGFDSLQKLVIYCRSYGSCHCIDGGFDNTHLLFLLTVCAKRNPF